MIAQEKKTGPIIMNYGKVWAIEDADHQPDPDKEYRVVFDIMDSPDDHDTLNTKIETAARFLNMHAQAGVPRENLKVALVVHNAASKDIISNSAYTAKYRSDNPNEGLVKELLAADVQIIFCGQSSVSRGYPKEDLLPGVKMALSAMTALIEYQEKEYQLIKF
jgi:intracellular sulfur oxidation DsrE/DsrF family protein